MKSILTSFLLFPIALLQAQIPTEATDISPILIGETIPDVPIQSLEGATISFTDLCAQKPTVAIFYRGGWCPYCNTHLEQMSSAEQNLIDMGYQIVAISPDSPEKNNETLDKGGLKYQIYSDASGDLMKAMGIAFQAPERYDQRLLNYSGGKNQGILPVPALFIIAPDGVVLFEYINPTYSVRVSKELVLAAAKSFTEE